MERRSRGKRHGETLWKRCAKEGNVAGRGVAATGRKKRKNGGAAALDEHLFFVAAPCRAVSCRGVRGKTVAESEERVIGHRPAILEHGETDEDSGIEGRNVRNAEKEWKLRERGGTEKGNRANREREREREKERVCVCVCVKRKILQEEREGMEKREGRKR